jgi:hypothetical protein
MEKTKNTYRILAGSHFEKSPLETLKKGGEADIELDLGNGCCKVCRWLRLVTK